jgi:hypothetical protein
VPKRGSTRCVAGVVALPWPAYAVASGLKLLRRSHTFKWRMLWF